ncbi:hypothetical protein DFH06DRAFT_1336527 [Mycena polygramma]|nr:hypothetical protein DFH06DRAFT_1336527 [Mycena polygramma]
MAAAQGTFRVVPERPRPKKRKPVLSVPAVEPNEQILDRFWRKVAQMTTRYHDSEQKWISGGEIREWNTRNREVRSLGACNKCVNSKKKRTCIIDEDHASCRTCRDAKIGCDRKPRFVFDMTKDEFFSTYDQFITVYEKREPGRLRRYDKRNKSLASETKPRPTFAPMSHPECSRCARRGYAQADLDRDKQGAPNQDNNVQTNNNTRIILNVLRSELEALLATLHCVPGGHSSEGYEGGTEEEKLVGLINRVHQVEEYHRQRT